MTANSLHVPRDDRVTINHEFASIDELITEYVTNISRSGVFIKARDPLQVGTKVNLRFTVIMDELETIEGIGEVVRQSHTPLGMGVAFVALTSRSQDLIAKLVTRWRAPKANGSGRIPLKVGRPAATPPPLPPLPPLAAKKLSP